MDYRCLLSLDGTSRVAKHENEICCEHGDNIYWDVRPLVDTHQLHSSSAFNSFEDPFTYRRRLSIFSPLLLHTTLCIDHLVILTP